MYITIKILDCTYIKHVNYKNIQHLMCKKRMHQAAVKYKENMLVLIGYLLHFIFKFIIYFLYNESSCYGIIVKMASVSKFEI